MAQAVLNQILAQLETLELEELQQLNEAIEKYLALKDETAKQTAFHHALLTSGLVRQIEQPADGQLTERQLIQVQGKPVSETILEERR